MAKISGGVKPEIFKYARGPTCLGLGLGARALLQLRPVLLPPGATLARPKIRGLSSTTAKCDSGKLWLAPLTIQNVKMKQKQQNERKKRKRNERAESVFL